MEAQSSVCVALCGAGCVDIWQTGVPLDDDVYDNVVQLRPPMMFLFCSRSHDQNAEARHSRAWGQILEHARAGNIGLFGTWLYEEPRSSGHTSSKSTV